MNDLKTSYIDLYSDTKLLNRIPKPSYISELHKKAWSLAGANVAMIKVYLAAVQAVRTIEYRLENGTWSAIKTSVKVINKSQSRKASSHRRHSDIDLKHYQNKGHKEKTALQLRYADGSVVMYPAPIDLTLIHKTHITEEVLFYRTITFRTFHNATKNTVRWSLFYRDAIRIGDGFTHYKINCISFLADNNATPRNTIQPFPEHFAQMLPHLGIK